MVSNYTYFFFSPLTFDEFCTSYPTFSNQDAAEIFDYWLLDYHFKARLFYIAQYKRHENILRCQFKKKMGYKDDSYEYDDWLDDKWKYFTSDSNIEEHALKRDIEIKLANAAIHQIKKKRKIQLSSRHENEIYALWFNTIIKNPPDMQRSLRRLKYSEYLTTDHWKRIRAAMLLSYRAVCQAYGCWEIGESWYGGDWELDLHVHHLTYKNKGNERYTDLTLLCRNHHEQWHEYERNPNSLKVKLASDN